MGLLFGDRGATEMECEKVNRMASRENAVWKIAQTHTRFTVFSPFRH